MLVKLKKNKTCNTCKYGHYLNSSHKIMCCNYIEITGRSRLFDLGKRTVEKGYCNKYEKGEQTDEKI
jgi:hypothetical protein